ncbi:hypothetical protein STAFG_8519 [Streptomyces afghaniensis 772]|uniref:Uncharacterized protein n=1 Tax=Streptomyces afghaniensis 772 TaxID=1283301 RepID=S4MDI7_9ACTN|nr:hypothetical protein STAFG_8519 [Streptomyces afghaniensis 772]
MPALRARARCVRCGLRGGLAVLVGRWSGVRAATAHGRGRRLGAGRGGPTGCTHELLARGWFGACHPAFRACRPGLRGLPSGPRGVPSAGPVACPAGPGRG